MTVRETPRRIWLAACVCMACNAAGPDPKSDELEAPEVVAAHDFDWDGTRVRRHRDVSSGLAFSVPVTGFRVTATHFDRSSPPIKLKHELRIDQDRRTVVRIDVWYDTEQLGLTRWFDAYLRFMITPDAVVERAHAGSDRFETIVVRHPRSPQALAQRAAVLWVDGRVVRITSIDDDDPQSRAVFERVLERFELGEGR